MGLIDEIWGKLTHVGQFRGRLKPPDSESRDSMHVQHELEMPCLPTCHTKHGSRSTKSFTEYTARWRFESVRAIGGRS